jgi:alpha/beta superfamily hydrolase
MNEKTGISTRWKNFEPTKTMLFWACVSCVALTMLVGFKYGGWVTGGTAAEMADTAADEALVRLAVASCVQRFGQGKDVKIRMAVLKKTKDWDRGGYLEKAGWATPLGTDDPVRDAGAQCAERLLAPKTAAASTTK